MSEPFPPPHIPQGSPVIEKRIAAGEVIIERNDPVRMIPVLRRGLLGVYRSDEDGKEMLLYYLRPGESCIMSFLCGMNHEASRVKAVAETDSELLFIPIVDNIRWLQDDPEWIGYMFKLYHKRFEELLNVINSIAFERVDERMMKKLRERAALTNSNILHLTHQQVADELATSREVVSRLLKQLEKKGRVKLGRNHIELLP